jgi:Flp pilus assembly protein TadD
MPPRGRRVEPASTAALTAVALFILTSALFWPDVMHPYMWADDPTYLTENPIVRAGLTWRGFVWAFSTLQAEFWHPLTWLSHMAAVQLFGLQPYAHHLINNLVHAASAALLFWVLRDWTSRTWTSALAAVLWAVHPLRVESVAWISERKDVLSVFFLLATLACYGVYARRPSPLRLGAVVAAFMASLMSKSTAVTLPFALLLADYWPLHRAGRGWAGWKRLVLEKIPLAIPAAVASWLTMKAQKGNLVPTDVLPLSYRIPNAVWSYAVYLGKFLWPVRLAFFYPYPVEMLTWLPVTLAAVLLAAITAGCIVQRKRRPYLLFGWLWFLGTLVPMIGLVQALTRSVNDRFMYLPDIGLCVAAAWGLAELAGGGASRRAPVAAAAAAVVLALAARTRVQLDYWADDVTLFKHSMEAAGHNHFIDRALAFAYSRNGDYARAEEYLRWGLKDSPDDPELLNDLGSVLLRLGRPGEALGPLMRALSRTPESASVHANLGLALSALGRSREAEASFRRALKLAPDEFEARIGFGTLLAKNGRLKEAESVLREAARQRPDSADAQNNLGIVLAASGRDDEAAACFRRALMLRPGFETASANLGLLR